MTLVESFVIGAALYAWNGERRKIRGAMRDGQFEACARFFDAHAIDRDATRALGGAD